MKYLSILFCAFSLLLCGSAIAAPEFILPLLCKPGADCFIQNYVDHEAAAGVRDYACGHLSYDGHKGTDFRLPSLAQLTNNVPVVAAAAGKVIAMRDGEPDQSVDERGKDNVLGKEAGNGVRIDHGDGWETLYGHMKRHSIRVRVGQQLAVGDVIGYVGLSGLTEFPHLHFEVKHHGKVIDPFQPNQDAHCGSLGATLWQKDVATALKYQPSGVLIAGWAAEPARQQKARSGLYRDELQAESAALVFWVESFGVQAGDVERFVIIDPAGRVIADHAVTAERRLAVRFAYIGKPKPGGAWTLGQYRGSYTLERNGKLVAHIVRYLTMVP